MIREKLEAEEAEKQAAIKKAEAEAEAILKVKKAQADGELMVREAEAKGIKLINEAKPSKEVLTLRSYEALAKVADGKSTKIIVPSDLQNVATLASTVSEIVKKDK